MNSSGIAVKENIIPEDEPVDMLYSDLCDRQINTTEQHVEMYSSGSVVTKAIVAKGRLVKRERIVKDEEIFGIYSAHLNMDTNTTKEQLVETCFSDPGDVNEFIMKKTNTRDLLLEEIKNKDSGDDIFSEGGGSENKTEFIDVTKIKMEDVDKPDYIDMERLLEELKNENSVGEIGITESQEAENSVEEDLEDPETELSDNIDNERNEENAKKFQCSYCEFKTRHSGYLSTHLRRLHGIRLLSCHRCGYKTYYEDYLKKHQAIHGDNAKFECPGCHKVFVSKKCTEDHILRKHDNLRDLVTAQIHSCNNCNFKTILKSNLLLHINTVHSQLEKYQCNYCLHTYFCKDSLRHHISSSHSKLKFICKCCKKSLSQKRFLDDHIVTFHPENVDLMKTVTHEIQKCDHCNYRRVCKSNMKRHMKAHKKIKPGNGNINKKK